MSVEKPSLSTRLKVTGVLLGLSHQAEAVGCVQEKSRNCAERRAQITEQGCGLGHFGWSKDRAALGVRYLNVLVDVRWLIRSTSFDRLVEPDRVDVRRKRRVHLKSA